MKTSQLLKYVDLIFFFMVLLSNPFIIHAQVSEAAQITKEARFAKMESKMIYPLLKGSVMTGVIPVENINNKPKSGKKLKIIFDFTQATANNAQSSHVNEGLEEVARIMNLHIAAGIKKEDLKAVVIFHSASILTILNNEYYQNKYERQNPNPDLLNQMLNADMDLIVCGQSLQLRDVKQSELLPKIQISLSAKTTLSKYQNLGYVPFSIKED